MKTKISRISRRTVSIVLTMLMVVSLFMVGSISVFAGAGNTTGNWYISNSIQNANWDSTSAYQLTRSSASDYYRDFYFTKDETGGMSFRFWGQTDNNKLGAYYGNDTAVPSSTSGTSKDHAGQGVWGWGNTWKFTPSSQLSDSGCFYKVRIHLGPALGYTGNWNEYNETRYFSGRTWYTATKLTNMSPTVVTKNGGTTTDTFNVGDTVSLSGSVTSGSNVGTVSYTYKYKKSTDSSYSSNVTSFTPTKPGTYTIQVTATDGGVKTSSTPNALTARTETGTKNITVVDSGCTSEDLNTKSGKTILVSYDNQTTKYSNIHAWGGVSVTLTNNSASSLSAAGDPNTSLTNVKYKVLADSGTGSAISYILAENNSWGNQTADISPSGFTKGKQWYSYNTGSHSNKPTPNNGEYTPLQADDISYSTSMVKGQEATIKVDPSGGLPWFKNLKNFSGSPSYKLFAYTDSGRTTSAATAVTATYGNRLNMSWTPSNGGSVTLYFRLTDGIDTVDFEKTFTVAIPTHDVDVSSPSNGTVYVSKTSPVSGTATSLSGVEEGSNYYIKAEPSTGYKLTNISINSSSVYSTEQTSAYTYTRAMGTSDETVAATFAARTFTVNLDKNASSATAGTASVTATYGSAMPTTSVNMPSRSDGYSFAGYYDDPDDGEGTQYYKADGTSARTWNKTSNTTLYAHWTINSYNVKKTETGGSGTVTIASTGGSTTLTTSNQSVNYGTNYTITVTAPSGYNVSEISGATGFTGIGSGTATLTGYTLNADLNLGITYVSATTPGVTVEANYNNSGNKANIGSTVTVTATKTHPTGSAGAMTYSVKLDDAAAVANTDYTISTSTSGNVTTYTIVPLKAGVFKVTAGYTDTGNPSATATFGVNTPTITVANNSAIKIGQSYTISPTITNTSGSGWEVVYSATSGSAATLSGDSIKAVTTGTAGFSASLQYNGVQKAATTFSVIPVVPTVAFGTTTAASINVGGTVTRAATKGSSEVGTVTSDTITYNRSSSTYVTVNSSGVVTGVKPGGPTTISATRTIVCDGVTTTVNTTTNYTVTVNTPGISAFSYSTNQIYIDGNTSNPSVTTTNPSSVSSPWSVTYSITGGSDYATINTTTGVVTGVYTGSATNRTVTVTASLNYNGTSMATRTATVTVKPPTVSFTSSSAVALNVGATNTNTASGSNPTGGTVTYSGTNQYINVNASTGQVTALKPTSSAQTVTASYAVTRNSKTTTVSTTYNVTVGTPSITFNGPATLAVGDKAATTVSATNVTSPSYTYDVKTGSSYASVDSNGKVTGLAAGTATIRVTATKESWTDTAEITVNVQAPSMTIADVNTDGSTKLYTTVGTNITKAVSTNFDGNYTFEYSKTGVATAAISNGTLTITPQAKGSTTITVTHTKAAAQITASSAGKSKSLSKGKLATGAAGDISVTQTFTVNVAEADNSQFITVATPNNSTWNSAYIYYWSDSSNPEGEGQHHQMTRVGSDDQGRKIYAIKVSSEVFTAIEGIIFTTNNGWDNQTSDIKGQQSNSSDKNKIKNTSGTKFNSFYFDATNSVGGYNTTITVPQISTPSTLEVAVDDTETITPTVVNNVTPAATIFESDDTSKATVDASTGVVTGVNAGSTDVTAYSFAPKPSAQWQSWITDATTKDVIAGSATTSVSVTDTPRTINFSNTLRTSTGGTYDQPNANLAGSISASYTAGSSGSGSGSGSGGGSSTPPGGDTTYYMHIGVGSNFRNAGNSVAFQWDSTNGVYYASYALAKNSEYPMVINTTSGALGDGNKASSTQTIITKDASFNPNSIQFDYFSYNTNGYDGYDCFKFKTQTAQTVYFTFTAAGAGLVVRSSASYTPGGSTPTPDPGSGSSEPTSIVSGDTVPNNSDVTFTVDSVNAGYRFVGWEENGTVVSTETTYTKTGVRSDYTIHARFEKGVEVTFKDYNDNVLKSATFTFDGEVPATPANDPTRTGYTFTGWSSNGGSTTYTTANIPAVSGTSAIVYVAQYTPVVYSVAGSVKISDNGTDYSAGTNVEGHQISITNTNGSAIADPSHMTHPATVKIVATAGADYQLVGIYRVHSDNTEETVECVTAADGKTMTCNSYSLTTENEPAYNFVAKFKKIHYITLYNTYELKNDDFIFKAAPPRKVKVGTGNTAITYTYASGTAVQRGEDIIATAEGTSGTYYEGNRIPVVAGDQVQLTYSGLASSEAITGIFYNNAIRYTHELEDDNLYKNRVKYTGESEDKWGDEGDDNWGTGVYGTATGYTYLSSTTLFADENFYDSTIASVISGQTYVSTVDNTDHTVTWTPQGDYLNIDLELSSKYRIFINNGDWNGIEVKNSTYNAEGYYYPGETINGDTGIEVSLDTSDSTKHFSFTDVNSVKKKTGDSTYVDDAHLTLTKTDGKYYIQGTDADNKDMPAYDLYVTIGVKEEYNMKLGNVVVSDEISGKMMLTETNQNVTSKPATATDYIGTITAVPTLNSVEGADISSDDNWWVHTGQGDASYKGKIYNSNTMSNSHYLNGGVNKGGTMVEAGSTVTYSFSFANGKEAEYSFVGWYEGKLQDDRFVPDYTKKLSGKTTFTYTPKKDTVVIAAGTRDMYLGGNFTSAGAYTTTSGSQTWSTGRIKMEFDPTYVNGDNKGRYYYKFDSVSANTEYQFRCYDTASGTDSTNLNVWQTWSGSDYADDNDDIFYGRHKYDNSTNSHGQFVYKNNTNNWSLIDNGASDHDSTKNHQANGYAAPVTVYFYAYDGGITVNSEYQWSKAYVSKGRGIDVISPDASDDAKYNAPSVSVANKTVGNKDVVIADDTFGTEAIKVCTVKEKDGKIVVTADPEANNLGHVDVQAFLVYNIETKKSEAVKEIIDNDDGTYSANITIPQNTKIYVVPIYKFTDSYISSQHLDSHTVYVRTADIDKDDWGGLVSMYSWGTDSRYDSGGWPGQLMIPSDDGETFYAPLTFSQGGLAGVTFSNYDKIWGSNHQHFVGTYKTKGVSDVDYSGNTKLYQTYDYREPIAIIENLDDDIYEDEDMDLTFELKPGNKTEAPNIESGGSGAYNKAASFEYLTDRSGKSRVDLNGNKIDGNPTETYRIVCNYTPAYKSSGGSKTYDFTDGSRDGTATHNEYSIDWTVYQANGESTGVSGVLSAGFIDVYKSEMLTYIASKLIDAGMPVSGRAVKIAYENPGTWGEAVRYSGQWYADGVNSLIDANVRVGIYSDGAWLPSDTNAPGYGTATVSCPTMDTTKGENLEQEFSTGYSMAHIIKSRGTNGQVQFSVDTPTNFLGWYREDGDGGYEPVGSNYKNTTITPSFNDNITYYAFYSASATYRFAYTGRNGSTKYYTAQGTDLTEAELAASGTLNATERAADINAKLSGINGIKVFNNTLTYTLGAADTSKAYTITYNATQSINTYDVGVYTAVDNKLGTVSYQFGNSAVDLYKLAVGTKPAYQNPVSGTFGDNVFIGWKKYDAENKTAVGDYLSTQFNFGYTVTEDMDIIACYGSESDKTTARADAWKAFVDKNVITQELTSETTGKIYNDSIIAFRNGVGTNSTLPLDGNKECGIVILAQANTATDAQKTAFDTRNQSSLLGYANYFRQNGTTSGKMNSSYGDAYAFCIKAESLSDLNRVDLCQILDFEKFTGGKFKVMSYYYDASVDGTGGYKCSEVISKNYTVG